ncbi:MAG: amidohydrolase [Pseudomonadota bacterium]
MSALTLSLIQADLAWHDPQRNRQALGERIAQLPRSDVIVLPEMFSTGFSMDAAALAEPMEGPSVAWLREQAKETDAAVCGSLIVVEDGHYYNRFLWATPDGALTVYDKRHLFRMAGEHEHYSAGEAQCTIEFRGFRVLPLVCYDLRFPVWSRNTQQYDLMIVVANWPTPRRNAWQTLLRARAIENVCYVAGVNRVGQDGNDVPYGGDSAVIDYLGKSLAALAEVETQVTVTLERDPLLRFRDRFPFHLDADDFTLGS